jgi:hypothetical protein
VVAWERSGDREAACELSEMRQAAEQRLSDRVKQRLGAERRRVADPSYVPTVEEAARHPDAFVDGMTETVGFESDPRD